MVQCRYYSSSCATGIPNMLCHRRAGLDPARANGLGLGIIDPILFCGDGTPQKATLNYLDVYKIKSFMCDF